MERLEAQIPEKLAHMFSKICLDDENIKSRIVATLIEDYLQDVSDVELAKKILKSGGKTYSLAEIMKENGLAD